MSVTYCGRCKDSRCPGESDSTECAGPPRSWEQAATEAMEATGASKPWPAIAPAVPVERIEGAIRLLFPDHMTPQAKRVLTQICQEYE